MIVRDPAKWLFVGGLAGGAAAGEGIDRADPFFGNQLARFGGGLALAASSLAVGLRFEHVPVTRDRFIVDAAEAITHRRLTIHYGPQAILIGAALVGLGGGLMAHAMSTN